MKINIIITGTYNHIDKLYILSYKSIYFRNLSFFTIFTQMNYKFNNYFFNLKHAAIIFFLLWLTSSHDHIMISLAFILQIKYNFLTVKKNVLLKTAEFISTMPQTNKVI